MSNQSHQQPQDESKATKRKDNDKKGAERLTLTDWYILCKAFSAAKEKDPSLSRNAFLRSEASGPKFQDTQSRRNGFHRSLKKYQSGDLKPCSLMRLRSRKYHQIEDKLLDYIALQQAKKNPLYHAADLHLSYPEIKRRCLEWAKELGFPSFKCSNKWISDTADRYAEIAKVTPRRERLLAPTAIITTITTTAAAGDAGANDDTESEQDRTATNNAAVVVEKVLLDSSPAVQLPQQQPQQQPRQRQNQTTATSTSTTSTDTVVVGRPNNDSTAIGTTDSTRAASILPATGADAAAAAAVAAGAKGDSSSSGDEISLEGALASLGNVQKYCQKRKCDDASALLHIVKKFMLEKR